MWLPINADRDALAARASSQASRVASCRAAGGSPGICDDAVQDLLGDLAEASVPTACCRAIVEIAVVVIREPTPISQEALQRTLTIRPDAFATVVEAALSAASALDRIRPLLRYLFKQERYAPLWTDLHSRLIAWTRRRPALAVETICFLCDVHGAMRAASHPTLHAGFIVTFQAEATLELIDAIFGLDVELHGVEIGVGLASQVMGIILLRLCNEAGLVPACAALLHLFALDVTQARDPRLLVVLSWVLRYHGGRQVDRDLRYLLETVSVAVRAYGDTDVDVAFHVAVTSLVPPLLELLSSSYTSPHVLHCANTLLRDVQRSRARIPSSSAMLKPASSVTFIDAWSLEPLSSVIHVHSTLASAWSSELIGFIQRCVTKPVQTDCGARVARYILDTLVAGAPPDVIPAAMRFMSTLAQGYAAELISVLPTFLYRLRSERNGHMRLALLYALPTLARSPSGLTRVLRIMLPLVKNPRLRPLAIRLLARLWIVERRTFSRLQEILLETRSQVNVTQMKRAVAASIVDVCRHSAPEAVTLVPLVQGLLADEDIVTVALSIQALRELCVCEELDLPTAYTLLEERGLRQFCVGRRPIALLQLFRFLECNMTSDDDDKITLQMLRWLWHQTSSVTCPSGDIRSAAYDSLIVLAERGLKTPMSFLTDADTASGFMLRLQSETSGCARAALERLLGVVCSFQVERSALVSRAEPASSQPNTVTFPSLVKAASDTVAAQWRANQRPCVRDIFAFGVCATGRPTLSDLVECVAAPDPVSAPFLTLALPTAWLRYIDACAAKELAARRSSDGLVGNALYVAVLAQLEQDLQLLDLGDSRVRGNVLLAKAALAVKAGAWGSADVAARLHAEVMAGAAHLADPLMQTIRPAALLAVGASVAALHVTDTDRRRAAFTLLCVTFNTSKNPHLVITAALALALCTDALVGDDDTEPSDPHLTEIYTSLQRYLFEGDNTTVLEAVGLALMIMWPALLRVLPVTEFIPVHDHLLHANDRQRNAAFLCLGALSMQLFALGAIRAGVLTAVIDTYLAALKEATPPPGALIAAPALFLTLRYASNYTQLPSRAPQQIGCRLIELIACEESTPDTVAASILGFLALIGVGAWAPWQAARLPTDLCTDGAFTRDATDTYARALHLLTSSTSSSRQIASAAAFGLTLLASSASARTALSTGTGRTSAPNPVLRAICNLVERRTAWRGSPTLASALRGLRLIRRYSPSMHLPLSATAVTSLLSAASDDTSLPGVALRVATVRLAAWQAMWDNALKRAVASLVSGWAVQPTAVRLALLRALPDLVSCLDPDSIISFLSSPALLPDADTLLIGLRPVVESTPDQSVREAALRLLSSNGLRRSIQDVQCYAACLSSLDPMRIETILPLDDDLSIRTRFELVQRGVLGMQALAATRPFVVGPRAYRVALVDTLAEACSISVPKARRLSFLLDLFDLMAAARDRSLALKVIAVMVVAWAHPILPADVPTLASALPNVLQGWDEMSVDSVVRRLSRIVKPSPDDVPWELSLRRALVPTLIAIALAFPHCASVVAADLFAVI